MTDRPPSTLLWVRSPPFSTVHLAESIRLAAMATALGETVRFLFVAEGVRAVVPGPEPFRYGPPIAKSLAGIVTPERPALVHGPSLARRGLDPGALRFDVPVAIVDDAEAARWVVRCGKVVPL